MLNGIDEVFIQDIENWSSIGTNWDYINPNTLFNTLNEAGVLTNDWKYNIMQADWELRSLADFIELVDNHGYNWDNDIYLYKGYDSQYRWEIFECCDYNLDERIEDLFDFEAYDKYIANYIAEEDSDGIIEIR